MFSVPNNTKTQKCIIIIMYYKDLVWYIAYYLKSSNGYVSLETCHANDDNMC